MAAKEPHLDYRTKVFWQEVVERGPMAFTEIDFSAIQYKLDEPGQVIFKRLLEGMADQSRWIAKQRALLNEEATRIEHIGIMMHKAGLRSYTDKEGRIYVAALNEAVAEETKS